MSLHRARGQAVGDDEGYIVFAGMGRQRRLAIGGQPAAEIGTHEVLRAVLRGARDREHGQAESGEVCEQTSLVERRVHGVAGAGVRQPEFQERSGGERCAAARQADAGRGQPAQIVPKIRQKISWKACEPWSSVCRGRGSGWV